MLSDSDQRRASRGDPDPNGRSHQLLPDDERHFALQGKPGRSYLTSVRFEWDAWWVVMRLANLLAAGIRLVRHTRHRHVGGLRIL